MRIDTDALYIIFIVGMMSLTVLGTLFSWFVLPYETEGQVTSTQTKDYFIVSFTSVDFYGGGTDTVFTNSEVESIEPGQQCLMKSNGYFMNTLECGEKEELVIN